MPNTQRLHTLLEALRLEVKESGTATAQALAERLGVSQRTLYRDLDRLRAAGIAVEGKAGVGLALPKGAKLPELPASSKALEHEARVHATDEGLEALALDPTVALERGRGAERTVRAASRAALVRAVLRAAGGVVVVSPDKIRREVRACARSIAKAHKA